MFGAMDSLIMEVGLKLLGSPISKTPRATNDPKVPGRYRVTERDTMACGAQEILNGQR